MLSKLLCMIPWTSHDLCILGDIFVFEKPEGQLTFYTAKMKKILSNNLHLISHCLLFHPVSMVSKLFPEHSRIKGQNQVFLILDPRLKLLTIISC